MKKSNGSILIIVLIFISLFLSGFEQQNKRKDIDKILRNIFISLILQTDKKNGLLSVY